MRTTAAWLLAAAFLLQACIGPSVQRVPRPDLAVEVADPSRCRIYCLRKSSVYGTRLLVRVDHGGEEIGTIRDSAYLCWEAPPSRALVRVVLENRALESAASPLTGHEAFLDLDCRAGEVYYCGVELDMETERPSVALLPAEEARALLAKLDPAPVE